MKKVISAVLTASTILVAGGSIAAIKDAPQERNKTYAGIAMNTAETYTTGSERGYFEHSAGEFSNGGITAIIGYDTYRDGPIDVYVEARVGSSLFMETSELITTSFLSAYVRPEYSFDKRRIGIYGLVGISSIRFAQETVTQSFTAGSAGVGAELRLNNGVNLFADYVFNAVNNRLDYFSDDVNFDVISVGVRYEF